MRPLPLSLAYRPMEDLGEEGALWKEGESLEWFTRVYSVVLPFIGGRRSIIEKQMEDARND